jgi:hypothetical protein
VEEQEEQGVVSKNGRIITLIVILMIILFVGGFFVLGLDKSAGKFFRKVSFTNQSCPTGEKMTGINEDGIQCAIDISPSYSGGGAGTPVISEIDPLWTANFSAFNSSYSNTTNLSYVPYIGANKNVNLGNYNFSTNNLNVTGNQNSTFMGDVQILGYLYGGSPVKVSGGLNVSGLIYGNGSQLTDINSTSIINFVGNWSADKPLYMLISNWNSTNTSYITGDNFTLQNQSLNNYIILQNTSIINWITSWVNNTMSSLYCKLTGCQINGNLNVTGNINVSGNITSNMIYGGMKWETTNPDNSSQWLISPIMTTAGTFYNFSNSTTAFSLTAPNLNGFIFVNGNALVAQVGGLYKFDGTIDYYTKSNTHTDMTLFVNGIATNFTTHRTAPKSLNIQPVSVQNATAMTTFNSDLLYPDGSGLTFTEANGAPPVLDANFTFQLSAITNPLFLIFSGYYLGSDSHEIEVTVWNYTSNAWVNIRTATKDIPNSGLIPYTQVWKFPDSAQDIRRDFINSTGAVKVRIQHTSNGINTHVLFVDQLTLQERRIFDRQTITGFARLNAGDTAWVMMKKDFDNAEPLIQRFNVNLIRVGN